MTQVIQVTAEMTVNEVLARFPQALPVLNQFGIDSCCGGNMPLSFAVQREGIALETLLARLNETIERA